jgi:acetyltransferase-like isoleucine patch superfamily enzyme
MVMKRQMAHLLEKLARHREAPLRALLSKALHYTTESARARFALRACDAVGVGARLSGQPIVKNRGEIRIGKDLSLICWWSPVELSAGPGATLTLGDSVILNYGTLISASKRVTIGSRVMIGNQCIVADTEMPGIVDTSGPVRKVEELAWDEPRPIEIGDGAWLAVRVTVLPGVKIGADSVITAGSIVAEDIPPGVIAGGIPARVLRPTKMAAEKLSAIRGGTDSQRRTQDAATESIRPEGQR